ncbi:MAG: tetratricopeptide repeat protein [Bacteroidetes bacterium]|nr:tetratricopeptide repeat protein [Bacteroidota bacterium]
MNLYFLFILLNLSIFSSFESFAINKIDSLKNILINSKDDSNKVEILNNLSYEIVYSDPGKAEKYALEAKALSIKLKYKKGLCRSYCSIGTVFNFLSEFTEAEENYLEALKLAEEIGSRKPVAVIFNNLGAVHYELGNYNKALEYYMKSLRIKESLKDSLEIAYSFINIGNVLQKQENLNRALEYFIRSLEIEEKLGDTWGMAYSANNIGNNYWNMNMHDKAREYYELALKYYRTVNDRQGMAETLNNLGLLCEVEKDYRLADKYILSALSIKESLNNREGMANAYNCLGKIQLALKNPDSALYWYSKGLNLSSEVGSKEWMKDSYHGLSSIYSEKGDFAGAYGYFKKYSAMKDTLLNQETSRQITEIQTKYETEKKEKEIALQKAEIEKKEAVIKQQDIQRIAFASGFLLMLLLAFVIFRAYRGKQKANKIISSQKTEVEMQKKIVEEKNRNITDSIEYASYIQDAVLPTGEEFKSLLPESFILFLPKDIVSGDFYWIAQPPQPPKGGTYYSPTPSFENHFGIASQNPPSGGRGAVLLAVCDCTGHGVPGAFMSMLCNALLNEAVNDKGINRPDNIFEEVRNGIITGLKQKGKRGESQDGMDGVLIKLDAGTGKIQAATANNPVYIVKNSSLEEIKPDHFPVGVYEGQRNPFTLHETTVDKGDMIYLLTDGYEDQLGGSPPRSPQRGEMKTPFYGKKFKSSRLKDILLSISSKHVAEQKQILEKVFQEWKGTSEQTDDVTIVGIRV